MVFYNKMFILILFQIFIISFQNHTNFSYINSKDLSIKNAFYIIRNSDGTLNLEYKHSLKFNIEREIKTLKKNFELIKYMDGNEDYFYIREKVSDLDLSSDGKEIDFYTKFFFSRKDSYLWKLIPKLKKPNKLIYYVQNKQYKRFWELSVDEKLKLSKKDDISELNQNNEFQFHELYKEVEKKNSELLEKEPIDVFIKYIDLSDSELNRTGIHQIQKDKDNQELKYSVRSILKNIPWIRKIFILMPNKQVKYFKPKDEIKEKIVYVKDKDLLGFESASIYAFLFNIYKMKRFGISENFILMDDDYFIAQPLNKNDFFYEENGTILPALVTSDYYEMSKERLTKDLQNYLSKRINEDPHSENGFHIQQTRALLFAYEIFGNDDKRHGKKLIEPAFSHNAIPVKISDLKEIHDYVINNYEHGNEFLTSLVRTTLDLQMHTLYMAYVKNKYDRRVSKISSAFYDLNQISYLKWNRKKLFVINTSTKNYQKLYFQLEKKILNELFPKQTEYELANNELEEQSKRKKKDDDIKNISLIDIPGTKKINKTVSERMNDINKYMSILLREANIIIKTYEKIQNNDTIYEYILNEEENVIKEQNQLRNNYDLFFLCNFFLFIFIKFLNYFEIVPKIRKICSGRREYKKFSFKH